MQCNDICIENATSCANDSHCVNNRAYRRVGFSRLYSRLFSVMSHDKFINKNYIKTDSVLIHYF